MNILFFSEQSPYQDTRVGGAENSMRLMAEGLAARGHPVRFASLRPDAGKAVKRFEQNGVEVVLCPSPRRTFAQRVFRKLGLRESALARGLAARGWDRVAAELFGRGAPGFVPDLVYAFYEMEFLDRALAARKTHPGMKIVMRMAGLGWSRPCAAIRAGGCARRWPGASRRWTRSTTSPSPRGNSSIPMPPRRGSTSRNLRISWPISAST